MLYPVSTFLAAIITLRQLQFTLKINQSTIDNSNEVTLGLQLDDYGIQIKLGSLKRTMQFVGS